MTRFTSRYPDRASGLALLLLRVSGALTALAIVIEGSAFPLGRDVAAALGLALLLALVAGVWTKGTAFILAMVVVKHAFAGQDDPYLSASANFFLCTALVLLGPGAYSIDAKIFGRRVILVEPRIPD